MEKQQRRQSEVNTSCTWFHYQRERKKEEVTKWLCTKSLKQVVGKKEGKGIMKSSSKRLKGKCYIIYFFWLTKRGTWEKEGRWEDNNKKKSQNNARMTGDSIKGRPAKRKRTKSDSSAWRHLSCRTHVGISSDDIAQKIKSTWSRRIRRRWGQNANIQSPTLAVCRPCTRVVALLLLLTSSRPPLVGNKREKSANETLALKSNGFQADGNAASRRRGG